MVALLCAPDHRMHRPHRAVTTKDEWGMLPTTIRRTIATTLSGAAIAGAIGAPAASAMPIDRAGVSEPSSVPIAPSPPSSAAAAVETASDAGFDVSSAAIGAAAGTGVLIVVLAAGGLAWRRPVTPAR
jgi:hypothetical protein